MHYAIIQYSIHVTLCLFVNVYVFVCVCMHVSACLGMLMRVLGSVFDGIDGLCMCDFFFFFFFRERGIDGRIDKNVISCILFFDHNYI